MVKHPRRTWWPNENVVLGTSHDGHDLTDGNWTSGWPAFPSRRRTVYPAYHYRRPEWRASARPNARHCDCQRSRRGPVRSVVSRLARLERLNRLTKACATFADSVRLCADAARRLHRTTARRHGETATVRVGRRKLVRVEERPGPEPASDATGPTNTSSSKCATSKRKGCMPLRQIVRAHLLNPRPRPADTATDTEPLMPRRRSPGELGTSWPRIVTFLGTQGFGHPRRRCAKSDLRRPDLRRHRLGASANHTAQSSAGE